MQTEAKPYLLVITLRDLITYRNGIINIKIKLIIVNIKRRMIIMNFIILLLGNDKAVLEMLWLKKYNLKIN